MNDMERRYLTEQTEKIENVANDLSGIGAAFNTLGMDAPAELLSDLYSKLHSIKTAIQFLIDQRKS